MNSSEPNDQALGVRKEHIRNERQGNANLDWVMYSEAQDYQKDKNESSSQQSSNAELLEMLKIMEQGLLERDIQLKSHLEKRD